MSRPRTRLVGFLLLLWGPVASAQERIPVEVTIDTKPARFALDTGASHTILFKPGAERLGLKFVERTDNRPGERREPRAVTADFHQLRFLDQLVAETKLPVVDLPGGFDSNLDGVIGWLPLRDNVITFDAEARKLSIGVALSPEVKNWQSFPLRRDTTLRFEVRTANGAGAVEVDTGSFAGVQLVEPLWKQWRSAHPQAPSTLVAYSTPQAGFLVKEEAWAPEVSVGDLKLFNIPVSQASKGEAAGVPDFTAQLGLYGLSRMRLVVDGKNGLAYVKAAGPETRPAPYPHNRLGAVFVPRDLAGGPLVAQVVKDSPADRAGIRDGDVLTKVDDLDVTQWRTDPRVMPLSRFFERPSGTALKLTIERAGAGRTFEVVLKEILSPDPH
jgi:PDZ domain/Aspartyl protease